MLTALPVTSSNLGEFVLQDGGKLWLFYGSNIFVYVGDITDESKLMGMTGATGAIS